MKLVIATRNKHKLEEIRDIFHIPGLDVVSAFDFPHVPDVVEDGETFEANAVKKAVSLARATGLWSLADDSGLEVDALGGAPGVYSARYAGEPASYPANNRKLLKELALHQTADKAAPCSSTRQRVRYTAGGAGREARFRCVIALSSPGGEARTVEGRCEGVIAYEERGQKGFGYDPLFVPEGYTTTFAEMDGESKNAISHRGRALKHAMEAWGEMLGKNPADWPTGR